jgi:hypothetical protein
MRRATGRRRSQRKRGVKLPEPYGGIEEPPYGLVDVSAGFNVAPQVGVQLLGFGNEFCRADGVLLRSHTGLPHHAAPGRPPCSGLTARSSTARSPTPCGRRPRPVFLGAQQAVGVIAAKHRGDLATQKVSSCNAPPVVGPLNGLGLAGRWFMLPRNSVPSSIRSRPRPRTAHAGLSGILDVADPRPGH